MAARGTTPDPNLGRLFDPHSIAVIGASAVPGKWGHELAEAANRSATGRHVFFVNHKGGDILGRSAYQRVADLPDDPDVAVISVPSAGLEQAVGDCLERSVPYLIVITAGLAEMGRSHRTRQTRLRDQITAAGSRLIGPNCYGIFDHSTNLSLMITQPPPGAIGLVSQSGNLVIELAARARHAGIGFSRIVTLGNQADVSAAEVVSLLAIHAATKSIALYIEDSGDLPALVAAIKQAERRGKRTVALLGGRSEPGVRAAMHHTGGRGTGPEAHATLTEAGAVVVSSPADLIFTVNLLLTEHVTKGHRLGIVCDGGGHGVVAADIATDHGIRVPHLSRKVESQLRVHFPHSPGLTNPVDVVGAENDYALYARAIEIIASSGEVDAVLLTGFFGGYSYGPDWQAKAETKAAGEIAAAIRRHPIPLIVQSVHTEAASVKRLRSASIPVYASISDALQAVAVACR